MTLYGPNKAQVYARVGPQEAQTIADGPENYTRVMWQLRLSLPQGDFRQTQDGHGLPWIYRQNINP